ncbi:MAG: metallophosphoesterase [Lachnospiraceae bacterium]|nr:metallophosphoesterase [Lachnospiraceae bacterium]
MGLLSFLLGLLCSFFTGVIHSDIHNIRVRGYRFADGRVKKKLRMVVLSDLHGRVFGKGNRKLLKKIRSLKPDLVLMAGDIMTAKELFHSIPATVDVACDLIRELSRDYPVYFALGNHESRIAWKPEKYSFTYECMMRRFKEAGAHILDNDSEVLKEYGIRIYGLSLGPGHFLARRYDHVSREMLKALLGEKDREHYCILLAHDPEFLPDYAGWGADLSFSGHYHGGIVRLPFLGGLISPKRYILPDFTAGCFSLEGRHQLVSCGLGTHTLPVRVFNPAELLYVELKPSGEE